MQGFASNSSRSSKVFTLIELVIILSIFSFLVCLIASSYSKISVTVNKIECVNNLKTISFASSSYQNDHEGVLMGYRNNGNRWFTPEGELVTTKSRAAYWGSYYTVYIANEFDEYKRTFKCPEAKEVKYIDFEPYGQYATYGFNGVTFSGKNVFFDEKKPKKPNVDDPSNTVVIHDAWEPMMEGIGDTPDTNTKQLNEYKRHDWGTLTLWFDGHTSLIEDDWNKEWYR